MAFKETLSRGWQKMDVDKWSTGLLIAGMVITGLSQVLGKEASRRDAKAWTEEAVKRQLPHLKE